MATEDRTRHDRLRSLLPRSYAVEPRSSALGVLLEVLADKLRDADFALERALRDKWLATSAGPRRALEPELPDAWVMDEQLPALLREAAEADARALSLRVARVLGPEAKTTIRALSQSARVLVGERLLAPKPQDFADEASMLARLQQLLAPLSIPALAQAPDETSLELQPKGLWARWLLPGEALEAAIAPAGASIAVFVLRGPTYDISYRSGFDALVSNAKGLTDASSPGLAKVSMVRPPGPLERLGAALELRRQPWETDAQTYRNRVGLLAPMLNEGMATPRVMLAVVLSSLHAEPCPILDRPEPDSTRGFGLPPKILARCPVCQGGGTPPPGSECPLRARATMQATVTDNPRTRAELIRSRLQPGESAGRLRVRNDSLFSVRPEIHLAVPVEASAESRVVASFRSLTTGDEIIVPARLGPGDQLTLRPKSSYDPTLPRRQQYWVDPPAGEAQLPARAWIRRDGGGFEDIEVILFASGPRFDQVQFASSIDPGLYNQGHFNNAYFNLDVGPTDANWTSFAQTQQLTTSPELRPGLNDWVYTSLSKTQLSSLLSDYELGDEELGLDAEPDFGSADVKVALELRWWTRPPARFRVRVPLSTAVSAAVEVGADTYMRSMIERVRPAGVHPIIDFALEPFTERLDPAVETNTLELQGAAEVEPEYGLDLGLVLAPDEVLEPDEQFVVMGVFDGTPFGISLFGDHDVEPGMFNQSYLDQATFSDD